MRAPAILVHCVTVLCALSTGHAAHAADVDFNRDVRPILSDTCYECHGPDEESRQADLRLDDLDDAIGWVIEPGAAHESLMIERLLSGDPDLVMPPPHSKRRPTKKQIAILQRWIEQGAAFEGHWAFVPPTRPVIPQVADPTWPRNPIDNFVAAHWQSESLTPRDDAPPRLLARRLSLALTGLPILPKQSDRFADLYKRDPDQAVSDLVDELLAAEAYGEHQAWYWMDAARYADTNGYQADGYRVMWPWRDWLIRSLNANVPFDKLTEQMLAGDLLLPERRPGAGSSADWIEDRRVERPAGRHRISAQPSLRHRKRHDPRRVPIRERSGPHGNGRHGLDGSDHALCAVSHTQVRPDRQPRVLRTAVVLRQCAGSRLGTQSRLASVHPHAHKRNSEVACTIFAKRPPARTLL